MSSSIGLIDKTQYSINQLVPAILANNKNKYVALAYASYDDDTTRVGPPNRPNMTFSIYNSHDDIINSLRAFLFNKYYSYDQLNSNDRSCTLIFGDNYITLWTHSNVHDQIYEYVLEIHGTNNDDIEILASKILT